MPRASVSIGVPSGSLLLWTPAGIALPALTGPGCAAAAEALTSDRHPTANASANADPRTTPRTARISMNAHNLPRPSPVEPVPGRTVQTRVDPFRAANQRRVAAAGVATVREDRADGTTSGNTLPRPGHVANGRIGQPTARVPHRHGAAREENRLPNRPRLLTRASEIERRQLRSRAGRCVRTEDGQPIGALHELHGT